MPILPFPPCNYFSAQATYRPLCLQGIHPPWSIHHPMNCKFFTQASPCTTTTSCKWNSTVCRYCLLESFQICAIAKYPQLIMYCGRPIPPRNTSSPVGGCAIPLHVMCLYKGLFRCVTSISHHYSIFLTIDTHHKCNPRNKFKVGTSRWPPMSSRKKPHEYWNKTSSRQSCVLENRCRGADSVK
jgi:hypothetical protein